MKIIKKITIGIIAGTFIGMFMASYFLPSNTPMIEIFYTKITATAIITGLLCSVYAYFSRSKTQIFIISIFIGIITFYAKYWITGHHFDPLIMGSLTGSLLGGLFAILRKLALSIKAYKKLESLREKGFSNYE